MTRIVVVFGFLIAFAAGLAVGIKTRGPAAQPTTRPARHRGWLAAELNLTAKQQEELNKIWADMARRGEREQGDRRRQLYRERDQAIAAVIRTEDKKRYDGVVKQYEQKLSDLDREWRESFQASVEKTKQILTPEQRVKYEELLKRHQSERGSRDWHHGERRGSSQPASQPGT